MKFRRFAPALTALWMAAQAIAQTPAALPGEPGSFSDIPIDIAAEKLDASGALATASGNVQISYGSTTIYCDQAQYDPTTRDVIATGNVRIYRDGQLVTAERAVYNLESKDISGASVHGETTPFMFAGNSFQNVPGTSGYLVKESLFTTSDSANPDWSLRARRVRIYPNDRVILHDVKLYIGNTPVMWFPFVYQSLNQKNAFTITPGFRSAWGAHLLTNYTFPISEQIGGTLRLDYLTRRGPAFGLGTEWAPKQDGGKNWGRFTTYGLDDQDSDVNNTGLAREAIPSGRYRVTFQARQYITEDIFASVDINKLSDTRFLQDFFENEFLTNPQPDNVVSLTKFADNYTMTVLARKQINEFFDGTERLPEAALDFTRHPLFGSGVFYEGQTSGGFYRRNFATSGTLPDYSFARLDSFHQLLFPKTFFGWLNVIPRAGVRGTWYSESGAIVPFQQTSTLTLANGSQQTVTNTINRLVQRGEAFRPVFNGGVEVSFKASKAYESVQSRRWGLDGLRHIVQPYANLSYVQAGKDARDILQIDRVERQSQPPPIDFPAFNTIDTIDDWNILRLGTRNRLQTRRDDATFNWLELDSFFDIRFQRPNFGGLDPDGGSFSNLVNRLRWNPLPWVSFSTGAQIPVFDGGFTEVNSNAYFLLNDRFSFSIGHRFIDNNVLFQNSSLLDLGAYFRINDNWGFSARGDYEFRDNTLQTQVYELHKDLSSWVASLGFIARNNGTAATSQYDYGVVLTFTLKDLPDLRLPLSFSPRGQGSSAAGKNP
ncbi:MAG: LPS assembly protein LptD [Chthoniobacteraceae bacterium]